MQGTGNDFIIIQDFDDRYKKVSDMARKLCDRHFGIGADGILIVKPSSEAVAKMIIVNADGSRAAMCGNGIRCFAKYIWEKGITADRIFDIETDNGIKKVGLCINNNKVKEITINMGMPVFEPELIPVNCEEKIIRKSIKIDNSNIQINTVLMGVPHTVVLGKLDLFPEHYGRLIEKNSIFPEGTNVNFCEVINKNKISIKTWERGVGYTLACGTGSCASVVICNKLGLTEKNVSVNVPGGKHKIEITTEGVLMTGTAEISFIGECEYNE